MNEYDSQVAHAGNGINSSKTTALKPIWQFAIDTHNPNIASSCKSSFRTIRDRTLAAATKD
jgi:hypothetical protein